MTVSQLINFLESQPSDAIVLVSSDSEGNQISELESYSLSAPYCFAWNEWIAVDEELELEGCVEAVVLWP